MRLPLLALLLLAACAAEPAAPDLARLPGPAGAQLATRICPPASGRGPLVLINHGSPASAGERPGMTPASCEHEAVRWFTSRGYTAALPMRRGYGPTGGAWAEGYGRCDDADYVAAGNATADDMAAALRALAGHPAGAPGPAVVLGQSAGGWGSLALAARNPEGVARIVNMAGGRGGWARGVPNTNCSRGRLPEAAARFGQSARVPTLWIYTANDSFFDPELAAEMARRYREAGGTLEFRALPAFGRDGHSLFFGPGGSRIWGPVVEDFLRAAP
jgi:pimeloyl-ACP methyl ester carboxylesterase